MAGLLRLAFGLDCGTAGAGEQMTASTVHVLVGDVRDTHCVGAFTGPPSGAISDCSLQTGILCSSRTVP